MNRQLIILNTRRLLGARAISGSAVRRQDKHFHYSSLYYTRKNPSRDMLPEYEEHIETSVKMFRMIRGFRAGGHLAAQLDPLSSYRNECDLTWYMRQKHPWLANNGDDLPVVVNFMNNGGEYDFSVFKLEDVDREKPYYLGDSEYAKYRTYVSVNELVSLLVRTYCGSVGVEAMHIKDSVKRKWLFSQVEYTYGPRKWSVSSPYQQRKTFERLLRADHTATFLGKYYASVKTFGVDGCEALLPALWTLAEEGASLGVEAIEIGMSHRGRMNTLHNFLRKPLSSICNKFSENEYQSGDIKFHLGARAQIDIDPMEDQASGATMHLSLSANPSHLEMVYPVVIGKTKAKQTFINDTEKRKVIPLLLHGDAAFIGQGIVPETMQLSSLPDYSVGGAVHVVINNQIGFTTDATMGRSSLHCTSAAYMIDAPVFHVNADDVDAVVAVCRLAMQYRQKFNSDCVVDLVCYRRYGHNSLDDPRVTQPVMYKLIEDHPRVLSLYSKKLLDAKVITQAEIDELSRSVMEENMQEFDQSKEYVPDKYEWLSSNWQGAAISDMKNRPYNPTGCRMSTLMKVGKALCSYPENFKLHRQIHQLIKQREKVLSTGKGVNMAFAEALAFGCLLHGWTPGAEEGLRGQSEEVRRRDVDKPRMGVRLVTHPNVHIRLSGQDVIRGTFNQRHAAVFDQDTEQPFVQLNNLSGGDDDHNCSTLNVCNSSLSEAAVLGFEYGYSLGNELSLTLWEAQFGDFANVAQSLIDNFIAPGESKWNNWSSIVLLLPHGYDGQGPEHSSARLERFLQLMDDCESSIPGEVDEQNKEEILATFDKLVEAGGEDVSLDDDGQPVISRNKLVDALMSVSDGNQTESGDRYTSIRMRETLGEVQDSDEPDDNLTREKWLKIMTTWLQNNSEQKYNMCVAMPSTPAQYFHVLRRQIHRPFAKPLVLMMGKWLHIHSPCASDLAELGPGTYFRRVIVEGHDGDNLKDRTKAKLGLKPPAEIRRVIFCSGQVYYHLYHRRAAHKIQDIAFVRLEQIGPFPFAMVAAAIQRFPNAELVWCQEEPRNMGAWTYIKPRFDTVLKERDILRGPIRYVGRASSAQTATGFYRVHEEEQNAVINTALDISVPS